MLRDKLRKQMSDVADETSLFRERERVSRSILGISNGRTFKDLYHDFGLVSVQLLVPEGTIRRVFSWSQKTLD